MALLDIFNDDLDILEILNYGFPRHIAERSEYFQTMDNFNFFKRFRLQKETVLYLLEQIEEDLEFPNDMNASISPMNQLLVCLRYFACGSHLTCIADFAGAHISSVSRIIVRVSEAIARLRNRFIKMPEQGDLKRTQNKFYQISSFPRVIGALDCTHIRIQSPGGDDAEIFRNRKSYFSINVQVVCDADLRIIDIVARWPGSAHDSTIFNNSNLKTRFEAREFQHAVLLGDSGYPLLPYLFTPHPHPVTRAEQLYNESQIRTRNTVERFFGVWKRRFPVLAYGCRLKVQTTLTVIIAAGVLHNIALSMNEEDPPNPDLDIEELNYLINIGEIPNVAIENNGPLNHRNNIIANYFANL